MLALEIVVIAAATGSHRVLAIGEGPTVSGNQEEALKPVRKVKPAMNKTWVGMLLVQIPVPAKFSLVITLYNLIDPVFV